MGTAVSAIPNAIGPASTLRAEAGFGPSYKRRMAVQRRIAGLGAVFILALLMALYTVGPIPLAPADYNQLANADKLSTFNRLSLSSLFLLSLPLLLMRLGLVLRLVRRSGPILVPTAWFLVTAAWSLSPSYTVLRWVQFLMFLVVAYTLAAALPGPRSLLRVVGLVSAGVVAFNLVVVLFMPDVSVTPLGEKGIYSQKNVAGAMALLFGCLLMGALWSMRSLFGWLFYGAALLADLWFLYLTRSKTALGIALLLLMLLPPIFYVVRKGRYYMTVATCLGIAVIGAALLNMMVLNITLDTVNELMFGDLTFTGRSFIWNAVLMEVQDRPLTGFGWGAFWGIGLLVNPFTHADPNAFFMDATVINTAHSGYMDILLQTGWVGLLLTGFATLWYVALAMRLVHRSRVTGPALIATMTITTVMLSLALNNALESQLFRAGDWIGFIHLLLALQLDRMALDAERPLHGRPST